jgi:hypothetical protein
MITVNGSFKVKYTVDLNVDSFDDINEDNMSLEESDKLIEEAIEKKYGYYMPMYDIKVDRK